LGGRGLRRVRGQRAAIVRQGGSFGIMGGDLLAETDAIRYRQ
jgi:hypothetical protein